MNEVGVRVKLNLRPSLKPRCRNLITILSDWLPTHASATHLGVLELQVVPLQRITSITILVHPTLNCHHFQAQVPLFLGQ